MNCFFCGEVFVTMELVMQHVRLKHKFMLNSPIMCKLENCNDEFTNVYSLRRHVLSKHYISDQTKSASSINSKQENDSVIDANAADFSDITSTISHFDPSNCNENSEITDNIIETNSTITNKKLNIDDYQSIVFKSALSAAIKIYADFTLSRKSINKIIIIISKTYLNTCIKGLQQCCENDSDLSISLNMVYNGFAFLKSEAKTFQYLQQINCLFLPKQKLFGRI